MEEIMKGFILNNNYKLVSLDKDNRRCIMEAKITNSSLNPFGIVHGGYLFGLADTAAGILANALIGPSVTLNSEIDYYHPVKGERIEAIAECIKKGTKVSVFEVSMFDDKEVLVSRCNITYFHLDDVRDSDN